MKKITLTLRLDKPDLKGANSRLSTLKRSLINHYSLKLAGPFLPPLVFSRTCFFLYGDNVKPEYSGQQLKTIFIDAGDDELCKQMEKDVEILKNIWGVKRG